MISMTRLKSLEATKGFTLVELMIVVAVIGILAAIAYPNYMEYVLRGKRAEARTALLDLMQQQERYFTQNGTYKKDPLGASFKTYSGDSSASGYYTLEAADCIAPVDLKLCVQLTAKLVNSASDPKAKDLTFDSTGTKSCNGTNPEVCWK